MTVLFVDKKTKELAKLNPDGVEFVLDQDGNVREYIDQTYADSCSLLFRDDVEAQVADLDPELIQTKPCPVCSAPLGLPDQYVNAMKNMQVGM